MMPINVFRHMGDDIGIVRYQDESDFSYCARTAYTASRFWASAFCIDDGCGGSEGITRQSLNRRMRSWIEALDHAQVGLSDWFKLDDNGVASIYKRLIDVGELCPNAFTDRYVAQPARTVPICDGYEVLLGFYDATDNEKVFGNSKHASQIVTGLTTLLQTGCEAQRSESLWWKQEWVLLPWVSASSYGELEYLNYNSSHWGLMPSEAWCAEPDWVDGITVARTKLAERSSFAYFIARSQGNATYISTIDYPRALELSYYLRSRVGNCIKARYRQLDKKHCRLHAPIGLLPGRVNRYLEVLVWPTKEVDSKTDYIVRAESIPAIKELLAQCHVVLLEV